MVADVYVAGVSTRRVEKLMQQLGVERMSKSQVSRLRRAWTGASEDFRTRPLDDAPNVYVTLDVLVIKCGEGGRSSTSASASVSRNRKASDPSRDRGVFNICCPPAEPLSDRSRWL
jgi:hypothetical protein